MTSMPAQNFKSLFEKAPGLYLVLLPDFTIVAVSDTYLSATMTEREAILGRGLFEVFPDNPADNEADGVLNLRASLHYVIEHKKPHTMAVQKYDIRRPDGVFEVRYWSPLNTPVLNEQNELVYIIHNVTDITSRQTAEEKLKKSEKDYQLLINSVKDYAIFMVDTNGCVASWNSGAASIKGYTKEEITGKPIDVFYTAEELQKGEPKRNLQMALQHGNFETEGWRLRKDGTLFWANIVFTALRDEEGILYGYSKITRDVTERKKAQEQLELLSRQINQSNDSIYTTDAQRKIKSWNRGAEKLYGYTKDEMMGKDPNMILKTVMTSQEMNTALKEVAKQDYWTSELRRTTKTHKDIWVRTSLSTVRDERGEITGYAASSYDITEQKKLREEVSHLASMVEQTSEAIFSRGPDQVIISWNRGAEKMFGYSKEEAMGNTAAALGFMKLSATEIKKVEKHVLETGSWNAEMDYYRKDGSSFFGVVTANLIKNEKGENISFYFIVKDISARKQLEEQLKEFEHFFNNSNDFSCIANKDGYFEILNPSFTKVLGYSQNELSENPFLNFVHPDDITATLQEYDKLKSGATVIHFFNRYRKKDGSYLWFDWNASPNPVTGKLYCIARDITDRKKAEDALGKLNEELEQRVKDRTEEIYKNEKRFRALIENNYDIISLMDEQFNVFYRSPSAIRITGWSDEEILHIDGRKNIHPDDREKAGVIVKELMSNPGKTINTLFRNQHKDGHYLWVEGTVINLLQDEDVKAIVFNFRDITARKQAEEELASSEERFRSIIEQYPSPVIRYAPDGTYITANPAWEIMWEDKRENVVGYNIRKDPQMIASGLSKYIEKAFAGETVSSDVYLYDPSIIGKSGRKRWIQMLVYPLKDIAENILEVILIMLDMTGNKEAEEKLAASEMRFRLLIENSAEGIALTDEFSNNIYRSPAAIKMMGPVTIENTISLTHPGDIETLKKKHSEVLRNPGIPISFQGRFLHASAHYIWLEGTFTNLLDVKGVNAIVANFRDITQRKELENLLHKANSLARIGGWEVDLIKRTVYWTDITKEIHETASNYMPDLETGINFYKEGKGRDLVIQKVKEAIEFGKPWDLELQIVTAKNNERWIRTIGETEFVNGKCIRIYGSFQDIDQRKKGEENLVKSEGLYRNLFTNMLNGFSYCHAIFEGDQILDYTYLAVNNEYEILTGLKDIAGKKMSEVIPDLLDSDPGYAEIIKKVALYGQNQKFETYVEPLGKWFSVSLYSPEKGYFVSLVDNITERKMAEQKIQKINIELEERVATRTGQLKKTNEEMEAFSYSVSHDLRGPLRGIIGFAAILEEDYGNKLDKEALRITSTIKRNAARMGQLIDDLLNFSRMGRQDISKTLFNTGDLVREIITEMNPVIEGMQIEWLIQDLADSFADRNMLKQVWLNLISNAVKYSGKTIHPHIEMGSFIFNEQTAFFIKDNGAGFDEKYKDKLFKVFQRLHGNDEFEGTGVGLAIVEKIISKHGGSVWAEAAENKGASFYFSLPVKPNSV
jgi:PAS domain S-box-containing protein